MPADYETRQEQKPSGFLLCEGELMPYWTPDGRGIAEVWREAQKAAPEPEIIAENDNDDVPF